MSPLDPRDEFYVSRPADVESLRPVYYRVRVALTRDDAATIDRAWSWPEEDKAPRDEAMYDLWKEDRNGFGLERVARDETPWGND